MRRAAGRIAVVAVLAVAMAALLDALTRSLSDEVPPIAHVERTGPATVGTGKSVTRSAQPEAAEPVRRCRARQLGLRANTGEEPTVAVALVHVRGGECRQPPLRITVRIASGSGERGRGTLFGPEPDRFRGLFHSRNGQVAAFRYSPACEERRPFTATVVAGPHDATMRIPVLSCGQVFPQSP
ncbi:MAG: hypothetical protein M3327_08930 [Actinomycetota bacterium]|nr:hypothetical protein [Actinomycetota bacterium]